MIKVIQQLAPTINNSKGQERPCENLLTVQHDLGGPTVAALPTNEQEEILTSAVKQIQTLAAGHNRAGQLARELHANIERYRSYPVSRDLFSTANLMRYVLNMI